MQRHCAMKMKGRWFIVFNAPFNNISASFIGGENLGVPGENNWPVTSHWETLSQNVVSNTPKEFFFIVSVILVVK